MKQPTDTTSTGQAVDPTCFRALATGVGQSQAMSERTGRARSERVVAGTPSDKKNSLKFRGYPTGAGPQC